MKKPRKEMITLSVTETVTYEFEIPAEKFAKNLRGRVVNTEKLRGELQKMYPGGLYGQDTDIRLSDCVEAMIADMPAKERERSFISCDEREWSVLDSDGHEISNRKLSMVATADSFKKAIPLLRGEPVSFASDLTRSSL